MNKLELHIPKSRWHHHLYKLNYKYPTTICVQYLKILSSSFEEEDF